jgi:hypothetical protein
MDTDKVLLTAILSIEERVFKSAQRLSERTVLSSSAMGGEIDMFIFNATNFLLDVK